MPITGTIPQDIEAMHQLEPNEHVEFDISGDTPFEVMIVVAEVTTIGSAEVSNTELMVETTPLPVQVLLPSTDTAKPEDSAMEVNKQVSTDKAIHNPQMLELLDLSLSDCNNNPMIELKYSIEEVSEESTQGEEASVKSITQYSCLFGCQISIIYFKLQP